MWVLENFLSRDLWVLIRAPSRGIFVGSIAAVGLHVPKMAPLRVLQGYHKGSILSEYHLGLGFGV